MVFVPENYVLGACALKLYEVGTAVCQSTHKKKPTIKNPGKQSGRAASKHSTEG